MKLYFIIAFVFLSVLGFFFLRKFYKEAFYHNENIPHNHVLTNRGYLDPVVSNTNILPIPTVSM